LTARAAPKYSETVRHLLPLVAVFLVGFDACEMDYPGETAGTYAVVGILEENTCGAGVGALNPLEFFVELRVEDTGEAIWRRPQQPMVSGGYANGAFHFERSVTAPVYAADPDLGTGACTLLEHDVIDATLHPVLGDGGVAADASVFEPSDGGVPEYELRGSSVVDFSPTADSDCSRSLVAQGGPFAALPCRVRYTLTGTPAKPF